jgi:hypothetical protein
MLTMIRFALIAYLSLTTVFRPALCCCLAKQVLSDSACCSTKVALKPATEPHQHKPHKNCRGHAKSPEQSLAEKHTQPERKPTPCDPDGENCPCGKQFVSMAFTAATGLQPSSFEVQDSTCAVQSVILADIQSSDTQQTSFLAHGRRSDRYGRELLRAYQIMRC